MSRDEGHNRQIVALFISLSIHVAAAAIGMWAGVQTLHLGGQEQRSVNTDAEPSQEPPNAVPARLPERDGTDQIATVPARRSAQDARESARARGWLDHLWQSTIFAAAAGLLTLPPKRRARPVLALVRRLGQVPDSVRRLASDPSSVLGALAARRRDR